MNKHPTRLVRRPLAAALLVALVAPGMAFAQTAREKALEEFKNAVGKDY